MAKKASKTQTLLLYVGLPLLLAAVVAGVVWYLVTPSADAAKEPAKGSLADAKSMCKALITKSLHDGKSAVFDDESAFTVIQDIYKTPEEDDIYIGVNAKGGHGHQMYMKLICRVRKQPDHSWQILSVSPDKTPSGNAE